MATGILDFKHSGGNLTLRVHWSESFDTSTGNSTVTITNIQMQYSRNANVVYYLDGELSIGGTTAFTFNSSSDTYSLQSLGSSTSYSDLYYNGDKIYYKDKTDKISRTFTNTNGKTKIGIDLTGYPLSGYEWDIPASGDPVLEREISIPLPTYTVSATCGNGISVTGDTGTCTYGDSVTLEAKESTGYHFTSWTYNGNTYTSNPWTITMSITGNISVTANADINSGKVYYYANGGIAKSNNTIDTYGKSSVSHDVNYNSSGNTLQDVTSLFTREGYHIASDDTAWRYGSASSTTFFNQASQDFSSYLDAASKHGSEFNLYANWVANTYTINYNTNGGTATSELSATATYDSEYTVIPSSSIGRIGYKFLGWTSNSDCTDDGYNWTDWSGSWTFVDGDHGVDAGTLTLYAMWEPLGVISVKITDSNNGTRFICGTPYIKLGTCWKKAVEVSVKHGSTWKTSIR